MTLQGPRLSVVINFYNMRREAKRTLFSCTAGYQRDVAVEDYEVIVVDNGSSEPLDPAWVAGLGPNFSYHYHETVSRSPCTAMNFGVRQARADLVMLAIDGARIFSPGILRFSIEACGRVAHPFVYTLGMHIGPKPQVYLVEEGYDQVAEDALIDSSGWQENGYRLFGISSVALSSKKGFFSTLSESNCFTMLKQDFLDVGGYDERFAHPGGGLINPHFFSTVNADMRFEPVMLLGEATFHQFHGGVATNVKPQDHPMRDMVHEYNAVTGRPYQPVYRKPHYFGKVRDECRNLYCE